MKDIVLVHSNPKLSEIYHNRLKHDFRVHRAFDGISGLRLVRQHMPQMLVAEHELPWLSGLGLLKFVRQHQALSAIPVIIISPEPPDKSALSLGANDWVRPKEVSVDELVKKIYFHLLTEKLSK